MTFDIACVLCGDSRPSWPGMQDHMKEGRIIWLDNSNNNRSPCECYQYALDNSHVSPESDGPADILIYMHSDLDITDPDWLADTLGLFKSVSANTLDILKSVSRPGYPRKPKEVIAVGLGGATSLGNKDLYRKPYDIRNMARGGYASNQVDAEVHGQRYTGVKRVAVLDAFFLAVRTDFLRSVGGWPVDHLTHHCLDLWLACEAARHDKEIWMVGAECNHRGGAASIGSKYAEAKWLQGGSTKSDHELPHKWLWDTYRDVLPVIVTDVA